MGLCVSCLLTILSDALLCWSMLRPVSIAEGTHVLCLLLQGADLRVLVFMP